MITVRRVRRILDYDANTGTFRWKTRTNVRIIVGSIPRGIITPRGYLMIGIDGKKYFAHRLAWLYVYGTWPTHQIDHINRVKTDNRIANLRDVPDGVNKLNMDRSSVVRDKQGRFA